MRIAISSLSLALFVAAGGELFAVETRNHYFVVDRNKNPVYQVTRIHDDSRPGVVTRTYLIADTKGPLLRIDLVSDYANRKSLATYALMRDSHEKAEIVRELPYSSTTMEGRIDELTKHPELEALPVPVSIQASSGRTMHGMHSDWARADAVGDGNREKAREVVGADLVTALDGIREMAGLPPFADISSFFAYIFDTGMLVRRSMKLMVATDERDCAFDAKFGVPCAQ